MGCGGSRAAEAAEAVALCRDRRDLIRSAADLRFAAAEAADSYSRALAGVGAAIRNFVDSELAVVNSPPSSPVLNLPTSEGKGKGSNGSRSNGSSVTPLSHSLSIEGSSVTPLSHDLSPEGSHLDLSSDSDDDREPSPKPAPVGNPSPSYSLRSSTAIPSFVYDPYPGYGYGYGYDFASPEKEPPPPAATPPPPPPDGSAWEFFDPFTSYEQFFPGYGFGMSSAVSSPDSNEVRMQEGIPDLEDELEVKKEKKVGNGDGIERSKAVPEKGSESSFSVEKESKSGGSGSSKLRSAGEESVKSKGVSFEVESPLTEKSGPRDGNVVVAHRSRRDVAEVVEEIKERFRAAADCSEEVLGMLEVGQVRYRSRKRAFRVISSRILYSVGLRMLASSRPPFRRKRSSATSKLKKQRHADFGKRIGMKSGNLSSTLEKLYVWEKKLYKEVKDEEKLRVRYERKFRQLKYLDKRGAESNKIDSTQESIRRLRTKISVIIKSANVISSRIHMIRDKELQPQLIELIQGLKKMWKFLLECHQKQFEAIDDSRSHNLKAKTGDGGNSVAKGTRDLELEVLNWNACFLDWIRNQKAYIKALNGWLMKWLRQEQELTPDGLVPFSPSRIEAPPVFIISNDWCHAIERIPEDEVSIAINAFAVSLHNLWELQHAEQQQKAKADYLSKDYDRRHKSLEIESGMHGNLEVVSVADNEQVYHDDRTLALDLIRKRLDEEKAKHEETIKQVQEAASNSLKMGLIPIFKALENFISEMLKAYGGLRIPNEVGGT